MNDAKIRLQKYISLAGIASRRKAEHLIETGKVKLNGEVVTEQGVKVDPNIDKISINNKEIRLLHKGLIMMNKPTGYITTSFDPEGRKTVYDLLTKKYASYSPIGRLDYNTSGLLLFTNDGDLIEIMTHPKYGVTRTYLAEVSGGISEKALDKFRKGIMLYDGPVKGQATIRQAFPEKTIIEIKLKEGRNRIVRRVMEKLGHPVIKLKRIAFGPFTLGKLKEGEVIRFSEKEYQKFKGQFQA